MPRPLLPSWHYASAWPLGESHQPAQEITKLGIRWLTSAGPDDELAVELLKAFHPYLHKYLDMIVRGHLPHYGGKVNEDARQLLSFLIPKGEPVNRYTLGKACRTLHLAFKGYEPEEIYAEFCPQVTRRPFAQHRVSPPNG